MSLPPGFKSFLEKLGINTTRLQWRLYQWEQKWSRLRSGGSMPASLQWMRYKHKLCLKCGALADREDKVCHKCNARLPSLTAYRVFRLAGLVTPASAMGTVMAFLLVIAVNFVLTLLMQGGSGPTTDTAHVFGAWYATMSVLSRDGWRALAFGLTHAGILHFAFNTFALSQVGPVIEEHIGRVRMLVLITVTQLSAAVATSFWYGAMGNSGVVTVGASGWLFGLIGFGITYFRGGGSAGAYRSFLIRWAIYGFVFGLLMGANNAAHAGGLAAGLLLGLAPGAHMRRPLWTRFWQVAGAASAVAWVFTIAMLAHSIVTGWGSGGAPG